MQGTAAVWLDALRWGEDGGSGFDPMSDVLFGLIAIVIPAIAIMLPLIHMTAAQLPARDRGAAAAFLGGEITVDGRPAVIFVATGAGLRVRADRNRLIPLDQMLDDRPLALELGHLKERGQPVMLLIEPDGQEAAFLFEAIDAAYGPGRLHQVRLDPACGAVRDRDLYVRCIAGTFVRGERR